MGRKVDVELRAVGRVLEVMIWMACQGGEI